jgi:hypothetical protein
MIEFYGTKGPYGFLSNFYLKKILIAGKEWICVESFYQAMKSLDADTQEKIRLASTPHQALAMGRKVSLRGDWNDIVGTPDLAKIFEDKQGFVVERAKDHFMYYALIAKFTQNEDLKVAVLSTGNEELIEISPTDYYWGIGRKRTGENKLGRMLQLIRSKLHNCTSIEVEK